MGKKGRKTRWRTLPISDDQSDSEESTKLTGPSQISKSYHNHHQYESQPQEQQQQQSLHHHHHHQIRPRHQQYYSKYSTYSSQSTPIRRYQDAKSTRSSSTTSENKILFNEDEYTKITTPRQDVLFKKGYLNKPKTYQTQTSTGTSTISTGNSTGNGTPDHQSADGTEGTDLEYESPFMFPNGFVDQNGVYYVNSFEPYPLVVYNAFCYPEYPPVPRSKRYSTDSMTESTSPHNEENQDAVSSSQSGCESINVHDYNNPMYNVVYPSGYYHFNGISEANGGCATDSGLSETEPIKQPKKKRCRKPSKSSGNATEEEAEDEEASTDGEDDAKTVESARVEVVVADDDEGASIAELKIDSERSPENESAESPEHNEEPTAKEAKETDKLADASSQERGDGTVDNDRSQGVDVADSPKNYSLKPDAKEFVPRSRKIELIPVEPFQYVNVHPGFAVPLYGAAPNYNPAYLPAGVPLNFVQHPLNYQQQQQQHYNDQTADASAAAADAPVEANGADDERAPKSGANDSECEKTQAKPAEEVAKPLPNKIDIDRIVSKLEEAAREQQQQEESLKQRTPTKHQQQRAPYAAPKRRNYQHNQEQHRFVRKSYASAKKPDNRPIAVQTGPSTVEEKQPDAIVAEVPIETKATTTPAAVTGSTATTRTPGRTPTAAPLAVAAQVQKPHAINYSETLKRKPAVPDKCPRFDRHVNAKDLAIQSQRLAKKPAPVQAKDAKPSVAASASDDWISVSNRKRRKNKLESDAETVDDDVRQESAIEEVPVPKAEIDVPKQLSATNDEAPALETQAEPEVKEVVKKAGKSKKKAKKTPTKPQQRRVIITDPNVVEPEAEEPRAATEETITESADDRIETVAKAETTEEVTEAVEEQHTNDNAMKESNRQESEQEVAAVDVVEQQMDVAPNAAVDVTPERKRSKKRKSTKAIVKAVPPAAGSSASDGSASLHALDESYDFLQLDNSVLEDEKTNVEISQELDKIIQRGLYSNLEEKIKSIDVKTIDNDDFFKTLNLSNSNAHHLYNRQQKATDGGGFFKNNGNVFAQQQQTNASFFPNLISATHNAKIDIFNGINRYDQPQPSTSKSSDDDDDDTSKTSKQTLSSIAVDDDQQENGIDKSPANDVEMMAAPKSDTLYPITQAVKDWMTKTRETTPEVEILKSPSTIYRELLIEIDETDSETPTTTKARDDEGKEQLGVEVNEDATLFSNWSVSRDDSVDRDLIDCWEEEEVVFDSTAIVDGSRIRENGANAKVHVFATDDVIVENGVASSPSRTNDYRGKIDEAEDCLEVYESKYGKNEDYLRLKAEIEEHKRNGTYPKHGNLPYRAICCSLM